MVNIEIGGKITAVTDYNGNLYSHEQAAADWGISKRVISHMRQVLEYDRAYGTDIHAQAKRGDLSMARAMMRSGAVWDAYP